MKDKLTTLAIENDVKVVRGYCSVDGDINVECTRDKHYQSGIGNNLDDCDLAKNTTKAKCEFWNKVTPFKIGGGNG